MEFKVLQSIHRERAPCLIPPLSHAACTTSPIQPAMRKQLTISIPTSWACHYFTRKIICRETAIFVTSSSAWLVGLLYVAREQKMTFRLTSSIGAADDAEKSWRNALITLRTVSGNLPIPEADNESPRYDPRFGFGAYIEGNTSKGAL